jgi:hypothetical protein
MPPGTSNDLSYYLNLTDLSGVACGSVWNYTVTLTETDTNGVCTNSTQTVTVTWSGC